MVLDRNDKKDFNDVVKILMIGEIKAHCLSEYTMDSNVRQVTTDDGLFTQVPMSLLHQLTHLSLENRSMFTQENIDIP